MRGSQTTVRAKPFMAKRRCPASTLCQRTVAARDIDDTHAMEMNTAYACAVGTAKPIGTPLKLVSAGQAGATSPAPSAGGRTS